MSFSGRHFLSLCRPENDMVVLWTALVSAQNREEVTRSEHSGVVEGPLPEGQVQERLTAEIELDAREKGWRPKGGTGKPAPPPR